MYITQLDELGETKAWSKPASELFGETPVSPDGGWRGERVENAWIAYLGHEEEGRMDHKAGDVIPTGVVAAFDDRGDSRWIAAGRHLCWIFPSSIPALCDGVWHVIGPPPWEIRPNIVEGRDAMTGVVTWKLVLQGEIDEARVGRKVLRIDENRYLLDLSTGPIVLDLSSGPEPAPPELSTGWCMPELKPDQIVRRGVAGSRPFASARNVFPCRLGAEDGVARTPELPIPDFAGVNVAGWGAWVEDGRVRARRQ